MKFSQRWILIVIAISFASSACAQAVLCRYESGATLFAAGEALRVTKNKKQVVVQLNGKTEDVWTYSVIAEDASLGYRAIRSSPKGSKETGLDVVLGGELFLLKDVSKLKLFITGTNAAAAKSEFASYTCTN